jgi:hypothetical protein
MEHLYAVIVRQPGRSVVIFAAVLTAVASLPTNWLEHATLWRQSPEWARLVFQLGTMLIALVGGVVPIAKWYQDRITAIKADKPIVLTDLVDGAYSIRNIGNAPATNVFLIVARDAAPIALGSLDAHQERKVAESLRPMVSSAHILLAQARPGTARPFTPTLNTPAPNGAGVRHDFYEPENEGDLRQEGPVELYLAKRRDRLVGQLERLAVQPAELANREGI